MSNKTRLDVLLVERGFAPTRQKAQAIIMAGSVFVAGQRVDKPGTAVANEAELEVRGHTLRYVSRGGLKLEKAMQTFPITLEGKTCADIGASTGGFTDCMLQNGARRVYAVDVGYGQLDWKLRSDERVVCLERTNARYLGTEQIPEPLLRFACYVAVSYKVYGLDFQYLDANYLFGLVEKVRPDMVKKLREHGTGRLPLSLQKRKTEHFTASANDAFAVIRITARDNTEECCHEVLDYLCEILEQEDFPRSYAVEFKGPEKSYLPITGLPKKGVNQLFACAVQYPGLHPLMERYARLAMRQYEQYTNLSDEQCALPGSFAVFALGMLGQEWWQLVWDYLDLCDDEHSHLQEKFLREYVKQFGFTADTVPVFVRGVLSMQNMKYSKDYAAWMANAESLDALLEAKIHLSEIVPSGFSSDEDDDDDEDEEPDEETEASPEEVLQYAWETVC